MIFERVCQVYVSVAERLRHVVKDEEGQGMIEYALLVALIAIVCIAALILLGPAVANKFTDITSGL